MRRTLLLCFALLILTALEGFAQEQIHTLQRGETIYTLARQYGVSAESLLDYNAIADPTRLPVGAEIRIPGTYVVKDGEYIYSIARKLGVNWQELLESNGLDQNDVVRPGDVLLVPSGPRTADEDFPESESDADRIVVTEEPRTSDETAVTTISTTEDLVWPHPGERETWDGRFRGVVMMGEPGDVFQSVTSGVVSFVGPFTSFGSSFW